MAIKERAKITIRNPPALADVDRPELAGPDPVAHCRFADLQPVGDLLDGLVLIA